MTEPVEYQTPLPPGHNLRFVEDADVIRISRDAVSAVALWREAIGAAVVILLLIGGGAYAIWRAPHWWPRVGFGPGSILARPFVAVGLLLVLVRVVRELRQNAGIVTEVAVTPQMFYWRKQTLWGSSEHFWPLATVVHVEVDQLSRVLKVRRQRGTPLGAFSFHSRAELNLAAAKLNQAIQRNKSLPLA